MRTRILASLLFVHVLHLLDAQQIYKVHPRTAPLEGGGILIVTGSDLSSTLQVITVGDTTCPVIKTLYDPPLVKLMCILPAQKQKGLVQVSLAGGVTCPGCLVYYSSPQPTSHYISNGTKTSRRYANGTHRSSRTSNAERKIRHEERKACNVTKVDPSSFRLGQLKASPPSPTSALCASSPGNVFVRFIHIPKAGGSSFKCTFEKSVGGLGSCKQPRSTPDALFGFQGEQHENYHEITKELMSCEGDIYERGGANCAPRSRCEPLVTMMAHPVDRFLSAFYQSFNVLTTKASRARRQECK